MLGGWVWWGCGFVYGIFLCFWVLVVVVWVSSLMGWFEWICGIIVIRGFNFGGGWVFRVLVRFWCWFLVWVYGFDGVGWWLCLLVGLVVEFSLFVGF